MMKFRGVLFVNDVAVGEGEIEFEEEPMNKWRHSMCQLCWNERNPERQAVKVSEEYRDEKAEQCCFCGKPHNSGIYLREDPANTLCKGITGVHVEEDKARERERERERFDVPQQPGRRNG